MNFRYITPTKKITGTGVYTISLDGQLTEETGDLNLYKIASNYLQNVPLQSGGVGDTGDMKIVEVEGGIEGEGDYFNFSWFPPTPSSYFPVEESKQLSINVVGDCNDVDTQKQGYGFQINPAYKPSIAITRVFHNSFFEGIVP